uniref:PEP-utilizing enzyme, mobile region n=2 Tax=Aromatoleum buckelii TaxID=200254 RepID=A0ABX1N355_9RHOO|nr:PEP-utilizing enzyme [Aromatoleum buckelii]
MAIPAKFQSPHAVGTIPGTEGWERMYPDYYQFTTDDPTRRDYEDGMFWFYDGLHYPEPVYPFDLITDEGWYLALSQYNTRIFSLPPVYGVDHRIINGYVYISPVSVKNLEEVQERAKHFMERAGYYYDNWSELQPQWVAKMENLIARLEAVKVPKLPALEDISIVKSAIGESTGYRLLQAYDEIIDLCIRSWQYHFEFLNLGYAAYVTFLDFCQKLFPTIPMQSVSQMVSGLDSIMYRPDEELKKLARKAIDLEVHSSLRASIDFDTVKSDLEKSSNGRKWLEELETARHPWFNITTGNGLRHQDRSWNDNLNVPLAGIVTYVNKLLQGESIERPHEAIRAERDRVTEEYRSLIETDTDRETFDRLLDTAKMVFPYVEDHQFYVENWFHSVFWNKIRDVAAVLQEHGMIYVGEDIWYLKRGEVKDAIWDLVTAWATGTRPRGCFTLPKEIEWRKSVRNKFLEWSPPAAVGKAPEVIQEPFTIMLWGVTSESLSDWSKIQGTEDLDSITEIKGFAGSPGIVEGRVRVCRNVEEVNELQDGEILVAPTTSPSWAPVFTKIKACVTDVGGVMCHAAIVCREYGMPAVVGTGLGTKILKNGMHIKVNGSTGEISIVR